jgi:hypothetical protein
VAAFVVHQCRRRPRSAKAIVTALRRCWASSTSPAASASSWPTAVSSVAGWTLAGLPKALEEGQVAAAVGRVGPEHSDRTARPSDPHIVDAARPAGR